MIDKIMKEFDGEFKNFMGYENISQTYIKMQVFLRKALEDQAKRLEIEKYNYATKKVEECEDKIHSKYYATDLEVGKLHAKDLKYLNTKIIKQQDDYIALEKELKELRNYCILTFGESHPEIKKCIHEVECERLRLNPGEVENLLTEWRDKGEIQYTGNVAKAICDLQGGK